MTSSCRIKGQRRGSCGHIMAAFDAHDKCARCRDKRIGDTPVCWINLVRYVMALQRGSLNCWPHPRIESVRRKKQALCFYQRK